MHDHRRQTSKTGFQSLDEMWAKECRLRREKIAADKRRDDDMRRGELATPKRELEGGSNA